MLRFFFDTSRPPALPPHCGLSVDATAALGNNICRKAPFTTMCPGTACKRDQGCTRCANPATPLLLPNADKWHWTCASCRVLNCPAGACSGQGCTACELHLARPAAAAPFGLGRRHLVLAQRRCARKHAAPEACLLASLRRRPWLVPGGRCLQPCGLIPAGIQHNHTALRHLPPLRCIRTVWIWQGLHPVQRSRVHTLVRGTSWG